MSKLIQMPLKDGNIIIEVETPEDEIIPVSKTGERIIKEVKQSFEKIEDVIVDTCGVLTGSLKKLAEKEAALETATLEFGFQLTGEGKLFMVKTATQGSIKVSLNLKLK
ncbi:MAG: hypothetical protein GY795_00840 [Desulfobacterales bacterium]|nr:hypothetical protein [Desulfobacterales bacterium]